MKRFSAIMLSAVLCFAPVLASCNQGEKPANTDTKETVLTSGADVTTAAPEYVADVPTLDLGGREFTILCIDYSIPIWSQRDIFAETENADPINDAVYARNRVIENRFNCVIKERKIASPNTELRKIAKAGDTSLDAATLALRDIPALVSEGLLMDYADIPHIDTSKPWWDTNSAEAFSIGHKLFQACSDLTIMDKEATTAMVFNKEMLQDYSLESPYTLVKEGNWTLEKLTEMSRGVSQDLDGNGVYDDNDRYGLLYQRDTMTSFLTGCGVYIAQKDADDMPQLSLNNEKGVSALEAIFDYLYDVQNCFHVMKFFDPKPEGFTNGMTRMFQTDKALFMWIRMADVENLRSMEKDFGILPIPKYNSAQDNYLCTVNPWVGAAIVFPISAPNMEESGAIIEALSAESKKVLQPAYYDICLTTKISRDTDSQAMLDIIFNNRAYDIGDCFDFGGLGNELINMTTNYKRDFVSMYEKKEPGAIKAIEKLVEQYAALG